MWSLLAPSLNQIDPAQIRDAVTFLAGLIASIACHEFGHAFVADRLGDPLPRAEGRVTLNPVAHVDPIGTLLFPLLGFVWALNGGGGGFIGWGKPVRWTAQARFLRRGMTLGRARFLVAAAGPLMNLAFGATLSLVYLVLCYVELPQATQVVGGFVLMNVTLACFNLLPCPPLDGGSLLLAMLPGHHPIARLIERYGFVLFLLLLVSGKLGVILGPAYRLGELWLGLLHRWAP